MCGDGKENVEHGKTNTHDNESEGEKESTEGIPNKAGITTTTNHLSSYCCAALIDGLISVTL